MQGSSERECHPLKRTVPYREPSADCCLLSRDPLLERRNQWVGLGDLRNRFRGHHQPVGHQVVRRTRVSSFATFPKILSHETGSGSPLSRLLPSPGYSSLL